MQVTIIKQQEDVGVQDACRHNAAPSWCRILLHAFDAHKKAHPACVHLDDALAPAHIGHMKCGATHIEFYTICDLLQLLSCYEHHGRVVFA